MFSGLSCCFNDRVIMHLLIVSFLMDRILQISYCLGSDLNHCLWVDSPAPWSLLWHKDTNVQSLDLFLGVFSYVPFTLYR